MDAQNWNEALMRIEASIGRMIAILQNRPRPASTAAPPVSAPASTTTPPSVSPLPPKETTPPPPPSPSPPSTPPKSAPIPVPKLAPPPVNRSLKQAMDPLMAKAKVTTIKDAAGKSEWRPPWNFVTIRRNDLGRTEWRPPW